MAGPQCDPCPCGPQVTLEVQGPHLHSEGSCSFPNGPQTHTLWPSSVRGSAKPPLGGEGGARVFGFKRTRNPSKEIMCMDLRQWGQNHNRGTKYTCKDSLSR